MPGRLEALDPDVFRQVDRRRVVGSWQAHPAPVDQHLQDGRGVVLSCINHGSARGRPPAAHGDGTTRIVDGMPSLDDTIAEGHEWSLDGKAVLEAPEDVLDPSSSEIRNRQLERPYAVEEGMW
jgi:hypothetical protein